MCILYTLSLISVVVTMYLLRLFIYYHLFLTRYRQGYVRQLISIACGQQLRNRGFITKPSEWDYLGLRLLAIKVAIETIVDSKVSSDKQCVCGFSYLAHFYPSLQFDLDDSPCNEFLLANCKQLFYKGMTAEVTKMSDNEYQVNSDVRMRKQPYTVISMIAAYNCFKEDVDLYIGKARRNTPS